MSLGRAKELREKRANLWSQANEILERALEEGRERTAEENEQIDRLHDEMDKLQRDIERLERHDEIARQMSRSTGVVSGLQDGDVSPNGPTGIDRDINQELRSWLLNEDGRAPKNFVLRNTFMPEAEARRVVSQLREQRALGTTPGSAGGHTVPEGFHRVLETALLYFGGMRQARRRSCRRYGQRLPMPTANDTATRVSSSLRTHRPRCPNRTSPSVRQSSGRICTARSRFACRISCCRIRRSISPRTSLSVWVSASPG